MTAKKRRLDDPEFLRRQKLGDRIICRYLHGSSFNARNIHETVAELEAFHGGTILSTMLRAIGISQDRPYGNREHGQFRIRPPDQPDLFGTWHNHCVLQALIVGYASATSDRAQRRVLADVYAYLGVTPVIPLPRFHRRRITLPDTTEAMVLHLWDPVPVAVEITPQGEAAEAEPVQQGAVVPTAIDTSEADDGEIEVGLRPGWVRTIARLLAACFLVALPAGFALVIAEVGMGVVTLVSREIAPHRDIRAEEPPRAALPATPAPSAPPPPPAPAPTALLALAPAAPLPPRAVRAVPCRKRQTSIPRVCRISEDDTVAGVARYWAAGRTPWRFAMQIAATNRIRVPEWGLAEGTVDARRLAPGFILKLPAD